MKSMDKIEFAALLLEEELKAEILQTEYSISRAKNSQHYGLSINTSSLPALPEDETLAWQKVKLSNLTSMLDKANAILRSVETTRNAMKKQYGSKSKQ